MKIIEIKAGAKYPKDSDYAVVFKNYAPTFIIEEVDAEDDNVYDLYSAFMAYLEDKTNKAGGSFKRN